MDVFYLSKRADQNPVLWVLTWSFWFFFQYRKFKSYAEIYKLLWLVY